MLVHASVGVANIAPVLKRLGEGRLARDQQRLELARLDAVAHALLGALESLLLRRAQLRARVSEVGLEHADHALEPRPLALHLGQGALGRGALLHAELERGRNRLLRLGRRGHVLRMHAMQSCELRLNVCQRAAEKLAARKAEKAAEGGKKDDEEEGGSNFSMDDIEKFKAKKAKKADSSGAAAEKKE